MAFKYLVRMAFDEIDTMIDQLKWYLLPCKIRKMISTILIIAQEPVEFRILGSVSCNRKVCKEVCLVIQLDMHSIVRVELNILIIIVNSGLP